jgi:hypothetical protein
VTWGKYYWPFALLFASVCLFGIPELIALFTNRANTLSEYSWDELHINGLPVHGMAWFASLVVWLVFAVVITAHIWWRW